MFAHDPFVGRKHELGVLEEEYQRVQQSGQGSFVLLRGRRRIGKSRLMEAFLASDRIPSLFYGALQMQPAPAALQHFQSEVAESRIPGSEELREGTQFASWSSILKHLSKYAEQSSPTVIVLDEFPYLLTEALSLESELQHTWDRFLRKKPIMLVLVGSDLAMMQALTEYGRPLYDRPTRHIHLRGLSPNDIQKLRDLRDTDAFDAYLAVGGFPQIARRFPQRGNLENFLNSELRDSTVPIVVSGERIMYAEFSPDSQANLVLRAMGQGARGYTEIGRRSGVPRQSLDRALKMLLEKQVVERELPVSVPSQGSPRYRIVDTYLRFWLRFIEPALAELDRGRGADVASRIVSAWPSYAGQAIESVVREAVARCLPALLNGVSTFTVGAFWNRSGNIEVDVALRSEDPSARIALIASIKWRKNAPFTARDAHALRKHQLLVPGTDERTVLLAVSASGFEPGLQEKLQAGDSWITWSPKELMHAWRS